MYGFQTAAAHESSNASHDIQPTGYVSLADTPRLPSTMKRFVTSHSTRITSSNTIEEYLRHREHAEAPHSSSSSTSASSRDHSQTQHSRTEHSVRPDTNSLRRTGSSLVTDRQETRASMASADQSPSLEDSSDSPAYQSGVPRGDLNPHDSVSIVHSLEETTTQDGLNGERESQQFIEELSD
ncbi:hypothetical protein ADUPG1_007395, partial [Aduncisulcus paluster]